MKTVWISAATSGFSALLGEPGNTILNGHNNVHGAIFRNLADLELGVEIVLYDANESYTYHNQST